MVRLCRITTVVLMILSAGFALLLSNALQACNILLQVGAGTGLIFILRWFWYRINVYSEITAMIVSFIVALYLQIIHPRLGFEVIPAEFQLIIGVTITTIIWVSVTLLTPAENKKTLQEFYRKIQPGGLGWKKVVEQAKKDGINIEGEKAAWDVPTGILCMVIGSVAIYSFLFSAGYFLYKDFKMAFSLLGISIVALYFLNKTWRKLKMV